MNFPENLKYTASHEWIQIQGNLAKVGITDHAQSELGDIVFVELPEVGSTVEVGAEFGTIEAVKTVADLYAPLSGKITKVNTTLADDAGIINSDPYEKGWICEIEFSEIPADLLSSKEYQATIH